jgi:hypothetical protein
MLLPGGGAAEMSIACALNERAKSVGGVAQWPLRAVAAALEVVPRTLAQNCGAPVVRVMTELRALKSGEVAWKRVAGLARCIILLRPTHHHHHPPQAARTRTSASTATRASSPT